MKTIAIVPLFFIFGTLSAQLTIYDFFRYQEGDKESITNYLYENGIKYYWEDPTVYDFVSEELTASGLAANLDFWAAAADSVSWTFSIYSLDNYNKVLVYQYLTENESLLGLNLGPLDLETAGSNDAYSMQQAIHDGIIIKKLTNKNKGVTSIRVYKEGAIERVTGYGRKEFPRKKNEGTPMAGDSVETPFRVVEKMPFPPGDEMSKLVEYIKGNITYPQRARDNDIEGTVYVQFVVMPDGSVDNIKALRGPGFDLIESAMNIVRLMPNWTPGEQKGEPVPVYYILPVKFSLN